jgi:hypothetical protein
MWTVGRKQVVVGAILGTLCLAVAAFIVVNETRVRAENGPLWRANGVADPGSSAEPSAESSISATSAPANCGRLAFDLPSASALRAYPKKVFAYYFPPYPVSIENKDPGSDYWSKWNANPVPGVKQGDGMLDRPLSRAPLSGDNWRQKDFETEIRQAMGMGLDGFIWEYHTNSTDARWNRLPEMLAAVKAVDSGFRIMLSPDLVKGADTAPEQIINDVMKVKDEPALYKVDGAIVLAPFSADRKPPAWWDQVRAALAANGVKTVLVPYLAGSPATKAAEWNNSVYGYASWGNRWESGAEANRKGAGEAHAKSRVYLATAAFEDIRIYDGRYWEARGSAALRAMMEKSIEGNAEWIGLVTWNDYTESWIGPSRERGTAVGDVLAYYSAWFKTGKRPTLVRDALYYFHRSQLTTASYDTGKQTVKMYIPYGDPAVNEVELLAFLAEPATLVITQGNNVQRKDFPAGVASFKAPLLPGTTPAFDIQRNGSTVHKVQSKTPVRSSVSTQDLMYHAGGATAC